MNWILILYLLFSLPKLFIDRLKGKRHPAFLQRLGAQIPDPGSKSVIWLHSVSVGETKSAQSLFRALKREYPDAFFLITTTTATGQVEAKRSMPQADAFRYLPLDFSWVVQRWVNKLHPKLFLLVESDFWPNLLAAVQKNGGKTILVSGKLSERSFRRLQMFSFFAKKLFSKLDLLCVQNEEHARRFLPFVDHFKIQITGNLKLDAEPQPVDVARWGGLFSGPHLAITCTHAPEEDLLIEALRDAPWTLSSPPAIPSGSMRSPNFWKRKKSPSFAGARSIRKEEGRGSF